MPKPKESLHIVGISDSHVGSTVALWPDGFETATGNLLLPNPLQKWFLKCHNELIYNVIPRWVGKDPFDLVFNGDTIEGIHHRSKQIMTHDIGDQLAAFIVLYEPLVRAANRIFFTLGTECHTQQAEYFIGRELGAERDPATGLPAFNRLRIEKFGQLFSIQHHIGTSARKWTTGTAAVAALYNERMESLDAGHRPPDHIMRAHRHVPGVYGPPQHKAIITGAWQGLTRHGFKVVPDAVSTPSAVCISAPDFEGEGIKCREHQWKPEEEPIIR